MKRKTQRIAILLILFFKIVIGVWDLITDIIYVHAAQFQQEYIRYLMLFFIIITPFIMLITWSVTLGKIKLEQNKNMEKERKKSEQYLASSENILQFIYRLLQVSLQEYYVLFKYSLRQLLKAFVITTLQTLKVFPFFLIAYTFKKFEVVITPELLKYAAQQTTLYKNLMRQKESANQSTLDEENQIVTLTEISDANSSNENINQILEVNIRPTFLQIAEDRTLKKLIEINEIFISIFEAMPMSILQFINNHELSQWTYNDGSLNWFIILSFTSSVMSVFYNIFILSHWMFDSEIKSFFDLLTCMMESQKGRKEEKVKKVFAFFDIPSKVLITSQNQLQKMAQLKPDRFQKIKQLHINLPKNKNSFDIILSDLHKILKNLRQQNKTLQSFSLNLSECNMTPKEGLELVNEIRVLQAESKYMNVKQILESTQIECNDVEMLIERILNMKISSNIFLFSDQFVLYRITDQEKMNDIIEFLNSHKIKTESIEKINIHKNFYVNIHQEQQISKEQLQIILNEKDESLVQINIRLNESNRQYNYVESYPLRFPQYLETFHYLQVNSSEQMDFQQFTKILLRNLIDNYNQGIVINANLQYNQTATQTELLKYFLRLYKLDANFKIQTNNEIGTKQLLENEELEFSNMINFDNDTVALKGISRSKDQNQAPPKLNNVYSLMAKEEPFKFPEEAQLNDKMLFQCIKIDDCILIGSSKALFNQDDLLDYLHSEEGNYSSIFLFLEFGLSQEFIIKLQAQLLEYFQQMNNLRHLHMIIGECGSFFIDLQEHFTFIENVLIFQNDLFQFKVSQQAHANQGNLEKKKSQRIYTYADLVSDSFETDLNLPGSDEYIQSILMTARRGLDVHKYSIQQDLQRLFSLQDISRQNDEKFNPSKITFNKEEVILPLELPPLSARLLPQALKQMMEVKKLSIYDNVDMDVQDFIQQNSNTLQYLKIKNSKIKRCNCGIKHQVKSSEQKEFECHDKNKVVSIDGVVYRSNFIQLIDINNLKQLKYLNITQSLMYLYHDYNHLVSSLSSLSHKLQVVKLGFQNSNIHFSNEITNFLCNTCILHTFEINAVDNYNFIGLDHIIKGLSFNFLISNIGIRVSSHQLSKHDLDLMIELFQKRKTKGNLKSIKLQIKKYTNCKQNQYQLSPQQVLAFFNEVIENILNIPTMNKVSLSFTQFKTLIRQQDLPNLSKLLFERVYKKIKINLLGNKMASDFVILDSQMILNHQFNANQCQKIIFKCDQIEQIQNNHIINKILDLSIPTKVLTIPYEICNQGKSRRTVEGQRIYLNIIADLSMDSVNNLKFNQNLTKLVLDFSHNINLLSEELISLILNLQKENESLKYLYITTQQKLFTTTEQNQIKQLIQRFKHFQPKYFVLK